MVREQRKNRRYPWISGRRRESTKGEGPECYQHRGPSRPPKLESLGSLPATDFDGITDLFYGTGGLLIGFWFLHSNNCQRKPMPAKLNQPQQDSLLRVVPHITARMGISRSGWWKGVKDGKFPPGIKLSPRVTVWKSSEIDSLIASLGR